MSAGIYFFNRSILNKIPQGKTCSLEREVFPNLPREKTYGYRIREHLYDIGTPERLEVFKKVYADLQAAHVIQ
jgi:mannose-1-phosphate guanylyltransferase